MNGEIFQISSIVIATKNALKENRNIIFKPSEYENTILFKFTSSFFPKDINKWYKKSLRKGLKNIQLYLPVNVKDRNKLGFINTSQSCMICYYKNKISLFYPSWQFDKNIKKWNILYTEKIIEDNSFENISYKNNIDSYINTLENIKKLAHDIEFDYFANIFNNAIEALSGNYEDIDKKMNLQLPEENKKLFYAASIADVFGAMGSWNDSPPYAAHEKNLSEEYDFLSNSLLIENRLAILYAVNEF